MTKLKWNEHRTRIRRFLRDPDANIWTDADILTLFNQEQDEFQNVVGGVRTVELIRLPPLFESTYMFDFEWPYTSHETGYVNSLPSDLKYYDQGYAFCTYRWEGPHIAGHTSPGSDAGTFCFHPWETWMVNDGWAADSPPVWAGHKFEQALFIAYDKDPIEPITKKELMETDISFRTRTGEVVNYWRDETFENFIHLYPTPSTVSWTDTTDEGMVIGETSADEAGESYGLVTDYTGAVDNSNFGACIDLLDLEDNLLVAYIKQPSEIVYDDDESDFRSYFTKYIEFGTLEQAYRMENDGKIESLSDYWSYRKSIAVRLMRIFKYKKLEDRDLCLKTKMSLPRKRQRLWRLPDVIETS